MDMEKEDNSLGSRGEEQKDKEEGSQIAEGKTKVDNPYKKKIATTVTGGGGRGRKRVTFARGSQVLQGRGMNRGISGNGSNRYEGEVYGSNKEEREWRNNAKVSEMVLDVTIWLKKKNEGRFKYDMNDRLPPLRELLKIIKKNDGKASYVNHAGKNSAIIAEKLIKNTKTYKIRRLMERKLKSWDGI